MPRISGAVDPAILAGFHETLQHPNVALLVAGFVDRRLRNERRMAEPLVIQQSPESLDAHRSLPNVLMPVELGASWSLGVVAVPHANRLEPHRRAHLLHSLHIAFVAHHVVARDMGMACVEKNAGGRSRLENRHPLAAL